VATRSVLAWLLGTGVPVAGVVAIGILGLSGDKTATVHALSIAMVVLGGTGIAVGLLAVTVAARATADPVDSVRRALGRVAGRRIRRSRACLRRTQIGQLQLGFMRWSRDSRNANAFARRSAPMSTRTSRGTCCGRGRTWPEAGRGDDHVHRRPQLHRLRERTPAPEVVAAINELFEKIVPIIREHGGRIDKFVGDGCWRCSALPRARRITPTGRSPLRSRSRTP